MILDILTGMLSDIPHELSLGRMMESAILLSIIWSKLKPHLKTIEDRLQCVETAVKHGGATGESRFAKIETRVETLEGVIHGNSVRPQGPWKPIES